MGIKRIFLGWDRTLLEIVTERLAADHEFKDGILDLSRMLFILPTVQSGRAFRKKLAKFAESNKASVLTGRIVAPAFLLEQAAKDPSVAGTCLAFIVWVSVLKNADIRRFPSVFPVPSAIKRDLRWAMGVAERMLLLQNRLGEAGLTMQDVAGMDFEESRRWGELAEIENLFLAKLASAGMKEFNRAKRDSRIVLNGDFDKIIVAGVPDPVPLAMEKLAEISKSVHVEIWIHAPEDLSVHFDHFGRPEPEFWETADIKIPDESWIHVAGGCESQAETAVQVLAGIDTNIKAFELALCAANEELFPSLDNTLARHGIQLYDPAGKTLAKSPVCHLLECVSRLASAQSLEAVAELARNPDFLKYFISANSLSGPSGILDPLDTFSLEHLDSGLSPKCGFENPCLDSLVAKCRAIIESFAAKPISSFVRELLSEIYADTEIHPEVSQRDRMLSQAASHIDEILGNLHAAESFAGLDNQESLDILCRMLKSKAIYHDKPAHALDLLGWLEMPWQEARHIIISGMNDGFLPDSVVGDAFLPDSMLQKLNLGHNARRFARDSFILQSLMKPRESGSVHMIVGKRGKDNNPLKPSRLLFKCDDNVLLSRAMRLFAESEPPDEKQHEFSPAWLLDPPEFNANISSLHVTEFKSYLACPFRFYLKKCLGMSQENFDKDEMDPAEFGTFMHHILKQFAACLRLRESTDPGEINNFLHDTAQKHFSLLFGNSPPVSAAIQLESILQRLARFATLQAAETEKGWRITDAELPVSGHILGSPEDFIVKGTIDRIETNIHDPSIIRILDYKTFDSEDTSKIKPEKDHLKKLRPDDPTGIAAFNSGKDNMKWLNLQLPLYHILLSSQKNYKDKTIQCGYFLLHKTMSVSGIHIWDSMENLIPHARDCAANVMANIQANTFWPPEDSPDYDEFTTLYAGFESLQRAFKDPRQF
ncbi:MAG: PD-(D/E)XK nuclease family protein [Victivallales bacterium]|nr:PD-(D/E)XK nuclease family protein [Victivallales bacterium]